MSCKAYSNIYDDLLSLKTSSCYQPKDVFRLPDELSSRNRYEKEDVDRIVRAMVRHIGLFEEHFIVSLVKMDDKSAGRIHFAKVVGFTKIEIDEHLLARPVTFLMVLAHELSHKFLEVNRLEKDDVDANERFTDIASVFLGFGKFALNGKRYKTYICGESVTNEVGYLRDREFAFAYDVSCFLSGIEESDVLKDLSTESQNLLWDVRMKYRDLYPARILKIRTAQSNLNLMAMTIEECEKALDTKSAKWFDDGHFHVVIDLKNVKGWLGHLTAQMQVLKESADEQILESLLDQVTYCEKKLSLLEKEILKSGCQENENMKSGYDEKENLKSNRLVEEFLKSSCQAKEAQKPNDEQKFKDVEKNQISNLEALKINAIVILKLLAFFASIIFAVLLLIYFISLLDKLYLKMQG